MKMIVQDFVIGQLMFFTQFRTNERNYRLPVDPGEAIGH